MEIRTIGSSPVGVRPAADSGIVPQLAQTISSEQVSVQTTKAVPQVARLESVGVTKKSVEAKGTEQRGSRDIPGQQAAFATLNEAARHAEMAKTQQAVNDIAESLGPVASALEFSVDEELGRVIVKIVDPENQEVIKQIPSEDAISLAKSLGKMTGMLVKTQA